MARNIWQTNFAMECVIFNMEYRGCSYNMGINTSGTNSKSTENANSRTNFLIRNEYRLGRNGFEPNSRVGHT
jgi:hypothetical protein